MFAHRTSVKCSRGRRQACPPLWLAFLCCFILLTACTQTPSPTVTPTRTAASMPTVFRITPTPALQSTPDTTPTHYTSQVILHGFGRPDDLVFDQQGHLLFSDFYNGTISRANANGTATTLISGLAGPEGLVVLSNGTLIIAEQRTNRILILPTGARFPTVLRTLPGIPSSAPCKDGVDGIGFDATTNTLIVPDSPTGDVYRMSLDGRTLTLLASGITRPVGAAVDAAGNIYIADECGGALWRISRGGKVTRMGGFGMLDDVAFDSHNNILVTDLKPSIHALIRVRASTGQHELLASKGFIEPQGLVVDSHDNIYVSDDYADIIVEYKPVQGA